LRWRHPTLGPISPSEFVPLAETTALIGSLTQWVLTEAARHAAAWHEQGLRLNMAINVSPQNLSESGFSDKVADVLQRCRAPASGFELEFTEGTLASNNNVVLAELKALRSTGVRIALDDFGTGFSNLSYITHLPADIIKIDKSFIHRISVDERSAVLVRTLIQLAHRLNYGVVAEGIENAEAYRLLAAWGCDEGQGFFMSRPLDAGSFNELMRPKPKEKPAKVRA
jgi:EAL domain-containing protein (putative c-di-GMP-specific phosphodiesterase class I)